MHSNQGSQFSSYVWKDFLKAHRRMPSMSRRGNCHDNAVAESFFQLLKREAEASIREYIEIFYNRQRHHSRLGNLAPAEFTRRYWGSAKAA